MNYTDSNGAVSTEGWWGAQGDYRDTFPALPGLMNAKMWFVDYEGEVVLHCHFLKHEDLGMMDTIFVGTLNDNATPAPSSSSSDDDALSQDAIIGISVTFSILGCCCIVGIAYWATDGFKGIKDMNFQKGDEDKDIEGVEAMEVSQSGGDGNATPESQGGQSRHSRHSPRSGAKYELASTIATEEPGPASDVEASNVDLELGPESGDEDEESIILGTDEEDEAGPAGEQEPEQAQQDPQQSGSDDQASLVDEEDYESEEPEV